MVGGGIDDYKFFLFVGIADGCIFFFKFLNFKFFIFSLWPLVVLTVVGSEFSIDGGDGLGRI